MTKKTRTIHPNSLKAIEDHKFEAGVSGNPGGRPKKFPITDLFREEIEKPLDAAMRAQIIAHGVPQELLPEGISWGLALVKLEMVRGLTKSMSVRLISELTEGKPKQRIELTGDADNPIAVDLATVYERLVEKLLKK